MLQRLCLLLSVVPLVGLAEETRVSGPTPGYVFDRESRAVRPMLGVPGSAYLGSAIAAGVDAAAVSPDGETTLVVRAGELALLRAGALLPLDGAIAGVDRMAWSADGENAAVYSAASRQAQVLRNLMKAPAAESAIDVEGTVTALAFDGSRVIAGIENAGIRRLDDGRLLAQAVKPVALAIAGGELFFADRERNEVWEIRDYAGAATPMLFADERSGVSAPVGLQLTRGGRNLLVASAGARSLDAWEVLTRASAGHADLEFMPARLEPLGSGSVALLNLGTEGEPLFVVDAREGLAVYFVPAGREQ